FLSSVLVTGIAVVAITEALSAAGSLDFGHVLAAWLLACAVAVVGTFRSRHAPTPRLHFNDTSLSSFDIALLVAMTGIVVAVAMTAWISPPNNWDSMTYHLSRVEHWTQNKSIAYYPTNIPRQLHQNPGAEFVLLHLRLLSGSDRLFNLLQLFSMVSCA